LTGSDDVLNAAFRRCGALRVHTISDLFDMAEILAKQPRPQGNRLSLVTNAGGPGAIATDALISDGGALADLAPETVQQLDEFLPPQWSHHNPIDILGDASSDRYAKTLEVVAPDPNSDQEFLDGTRHVIYPWNQSKISNRKSSSPRIYPWG
jgi:acetyltransferase